MGRRYSLIVFDWDGTLIDSTAVIVVSIQDAARDLALPVPDEKAASHVIGLGLEDSLRAAVPTLQPERYREFAEAYRRHFIARQGTVALFEGVREMLGDLRGEGRQLAVATGKSRRGLDHALAATGLGGHFAASRCADETSPKPHPAMLLELMQVLRKASGELLMIGDTSHDLLMAKSAGVDALAVSYGAHPGDSLRACGPRGCVGSVVELRQWLSRNG